MTSYIAVFLGGVLGKFSTFTLWTLSELITIFEKFIQATYLMCVLGVGLIYNWSPSYLNITPLVHPVDRLLLEKEQRIKQRENIFYSSNIIGGNFVV